MVNKRKYFNVETSITRTLAVQISNERVKKIFELFDLFPDNDLGDIIALSIDMLYMFMYGSWNDVYTTDEFQ